MSEGATDDGAVVRLRPPNNTLNGRVVGWWRVQSLIGTASVTAVLAVLGMLIDPARTWLLVAAAVVAALGLLEAIVVPGWRFRVHRWEVTDEAVYVRTGAFWQEWHIAPMSRIQRVDTMRGPLERAFRLSTVTVTTASSRGEIKIEGLDHELAAELAERLTQITQATPGDAT
ncbi:PH domain-containing protein [Streptomyces albipurpureus]|uniref:PH domain-containing protein n=1 Tax=Streptomyces albipurpureus TaxID=2897419 RepID=A0ABT0UR06_9ACTN|nr:PH domain-containing protein [Streptomyces sp. CWNU-1]MCM2390869.1 PH domain-containing protein [Streptomyces sp. CWNU-1]